MTKFFRTKLYDGEQKSSHLINLLKECRRERRRIKDEMFCTDTFQRAIGTKDNLAKAREAARQIRKLDTRKYTPRKLPELFVDGVLWQRTDESSRPAQDNLQATVQQTGRREVDEHCWGTNTQEDNIMEYVKRETIFDGRKNDWLGFAKQQVEFYGNINQYITNQYIRVDELDGLIEQLLEETEDANYNVTQGYRVFKMLKEFRRERRAIKTELQYLEPMAACFDCEAMEEAYRYSLGVIEEVLGEENREQRPLEERADAVANVV